MNNNYYPNNDNNTNDSDNQSQEKTNPNPIVVKTISKNDNPYYKLNSNVNNQANEQIYSKPPKKRGNGRMIALVVCCCIVLSSLFGVGGGLLVYNIMSDNESVQSSSQDSSSTSSVIKQAVESLNNQGTNSENAIVNATAYAKDSVVEITTETVATSYFYGQYVTEGAGSGVIITDDGYILTCAHVVEGASTVTVTLTDGTKYDVVVVGQDSQTDIAVLKINSDTKLQAAVIGNSDNLQVGETAIAIGNPLGTLGGSVSNGIISALDREITIDGNNYKLLQTNAAINPGNSGGGLFNINGELIGIVNAKSAGDTIEGLGFAIPINTAIEIAEELIENGYISGRPRLGINVYEFTTSSSSMNIRNSEFAALLNYIDDYGVYFLGYDGEQTGDLQFGDRIIAIDGTPVSSLSDITYMLQESYSVGDEIEITVVRKTIDGRTSNSKLEYVTLTLIESAPTQN